MKIDSEALSSDAIQASDDGLSVVSSESIWSPPDNVDLYNLCRGNGCVLDAMERHGASVEAVEGARLLEKYGSEDSYFYGFSELGKVDIGYVNYPFMMSEGGFVAFVNGDPVVMFANSLLDDLKARDAIAREVRETFASTAQPELWAFLEVVSSSQRGDEEDGVQDIVTRWDIRNGCRACEVLGYAFINFSFYSNGKVMGVNLISVQKI